MADPGWVRVATLRTPDAFRRHLEAGGIPLAFDDALATPSDSPFARPLEADGLRAGNRFCVLPMEGWDGTADGHPTELTAPPLAALRPLAARSSSGAARRPRCATTAAPTPASS